jgi:hypothetical protein
MTTANGRYQLMLRSVGKPGSFVIAKNVPENAIAWKMGIARVGMNVDGRRRMLRMPRTDNARDERAIEMCDFVSCAAGR